jgi:hypothetical protein
MAPHSVLEQELQDKEMMVEVIHLEAVVAVAVATQQQEKLVTLLVHQVNKVLVEMDLQHLDLLGP